MLVRCAIPIGPMCFRCLIFTLSCPAEFLLYSIAAWTCIVSVMVVCVFSYLCVCWCFEFVNCLLNAFDISVAEVTVFYLKVPE